MKRYATELRKLGVGVMALAIFTVRYAVGSESTNSQPAEESARPKIPKLSGKAEANSDSLRGQDFQAFKIIVERNIFNPNRRPGFADAPPTGKPPKIESFSLIGTFLYEQGNFAIFAGTESNYNKVLKTGEMIGGCKIAQVDQDSVKLEVGENKFDLSVDRNLSVDRKMSRQNEGNWELVLGAASASSAGARERGPALEGRRDRGFGFESRRGGEPGAFSRRRGGGPNGRRDGISATGVGTNEVVETEATDEPAAESADNDILKKLMQKREQELNK